MTDPLTPEQVAATPKAPTLQTPPAVPNPRRVPLPLGGNALMYTRENLVYLYQCSHGELGRLLKARLAPLPIRIDGQILWYCDESLAGKAQAERTLARWRRR